MTIFLSTFGVFRQSELEPLELLMDKTPKCDTPTHTRTSRLKVCNSDLDFTLQRLDKATNSGGLLSLNE